MSANPIKEIKDSLAKIRPYIVTTPTFKTLSFGQRIDLKLEQLQHTGSFKCRGAFNSLLDNEKAKQGVVAASGGNHGAAVAYVAQKLGIKSHIFVPELSGKTKIELIKRTGSRFNNSTWGICRSTRSSKQASKRNRRRIGSRLRLKGNDYWPRDTFL